MNLQGDSEQAHYWNLGRVIHTIESTRRGVVPKRNPQGKAADDSLGNSRMSVAGHAIAHLNS
jgi:hypothetical protein